MAGVKVSAKIGLLHFGPATSDANYRFYYLGMRFTGLPPDKVIQQYPRLPALLTELFNNIEKAEKNGEEIRKEHEAARNEPTGE